MSVCVGEHDISVCGCLRETEHDVRETEHHIRGVSVRERQTSYPRGKCVRDTTSYPRGKCVPAPVRVYFPALALLSLPPSLVMASVCV